MTKQDRIIKETDALYFKLYLNQYIIPLDKSENKVSPNIFELSLLDGYRISTKKDFDVILTSKILKSNIETIDENYWIDRELKFYYMDEEYSANSKIPVINNAKVIPVNIIPVNVSYTLNEIGNRDIKSKKIRMEMGDLDGNRKNIFFSHNTISIVDIAVR